MSVLFHGAPGAQTADAALADSGAAIVVTGTRTPQRVDQALAEVTLIDRAAIEAAAGRTLAELLARESGLQFWSNGGAGQPASVSMRGLEPRHTLLIIDGVRYGSATLGLPVWDNIALESIERIEIVRGPLSALYGSDAVGGVVQIFTRRGAPGLSSDGAVAVGSNVLRQAAGALRFGTGLFDGAVSLQAQRTRGFSATNEREPFGSYNPDRDGFAQRSASISLGAALPGAWRVQAQALHSDAEVHYDEGDLAPPVDARAGLLSQVFSLQALGPLREGWRTSLKAARSVDEIEILATSFPPPSRIGTVQDQLSWDNMVATPWGTLLLLAEQVRQDVSRSNVAYDVTSRQITGAALGLNGESGTHHWQAALRRDHNSQFGGQTTGSLGYGHDLSGALRIGASFGSSFVVPSFNQLYYPGFGSPTLQPEQGLHRETFVRYATGDQQWRGAWFDHRIRGYIPSGPQPANVPHAQIDGLGLAWTAQLGRWALGASGEWLDARNVTPGPDQGTRLPRRARETLRVNAEHRAGAVTIGAALLQVGPRPEVPGYATADLQAQWRWLPQWSLALRVNNLADRRYQTVLGYNQPGREAVLTLRYGAS